MKFSMPVLLATDGVKSRESDFGGAHISVAFRFALMLLGLQPSDCP